jgi:hypothetical protein
MSISVQCGDTDLKPCQYLSGLVLLTPTVAAGSIFGLKVVNITKGINVHKRRG